MRFLYGDSTPFPLAYNFLKTLEAFMTAATRIVQVDAEGATAARLRDEHAGHRIKGLDALEQFHNVVMRAVHDTAQKVPHPHTMDYARAVSEYATRYIEEHRRGTLATNDRELGQFREDSERRATEMRGQLEAFLKIARLPVMRTNLALRLNVDGRDARYSGTAALEHPDGITTAFTIAAHRVPQWAAPRKVSDFVQGIDLKIGVEKSWLRGTVTPKQINVDDWTIMQFELSEESFELLLRRRLNEKEMLSFLVRRNEQGVTGTVEQPGVAGSEGVPATMTTQDVSLLDKLRVALRNAARDVVDEKEQLRNVSLDGQPVFETGLAVPFVVRLVTLFSPTVREISKRSPNEFELTLKVETDDGRREELYLRKDALVSTLQPLPAKGREVFAPLGLDTWVPSMTQAPPAVAASRPPPPPPAEVVSTQSKRPPPVSEPTQRVASVPAGPAAPRKV